MLKVDVDANKTYTITNWAYHIILVLDTCGLSYLWINQFNIRIHFNTIKSKILLSKAVTQILITLIGWKNMNLYSNVILTKSEI